GFRQRPRSPPTDPAQQRRYLSSVAILSALREFRRSQNEDRVGGTGLDSAASVRHRRDHVVEPGAQPERAASAEGNLTSLKGTRVTRLSSYRLECPVLSKNGICSRP